MKKMRINVLYATKSKGHGVATAFAEMVRGLKMRDDVKVKINSWGKSDIIHGHSPDPKSMFHLILRRGKKLYTAHQVYGSMDGSIKGGKFVERLFFWYVRHAFYNRVDRIVAVSAMSARILRDKMKVKTPIVTIYNTIDMALLAITPAKRQAARKKFGLTEKDFVIVGNGQMQPRKRIDSFSNVAQTLPDAKFIWVGGVPFGALGADTSKMDKVVKDAPDNVTWTGVVSLEVAREYLAAADVFWLPSDQENHPMSVLEAAGAELPIILRDIPEYDDTFRGDALMAKDDKGFAEIIKKLQTNQTYYQDAKQSAVKIAERFDSKTGAEQFVALYHELLGDKQ
ncbi:MAG: glycosyltransferase [Candidatus Nomurabacteria bacterium]|jgi:1,2-diacylglycerol-3-alpha-glucose alpha-1,2-galactosyltransferase|nr:glycosyltransferase [Candidatus Nomurabacteria bacterium]